MIDLLNPKTDADRLATLRKLGSGKFNGAEAICAQRDTCARYLQWRDYDRLLKNVCVSVFDAVRNCEYKIEVQL